jgi:hypothetical protein
LKYSFENDLHLFQPTIKKGGHMLQHSGEKTLTLISDVPRKGGALSCSHLSTPTNPTKIGKNPTKT